MPKAKFYYGTKGQLDDKNIENGALYMTTDEEKWYVDMDGERHLLSQGTEFEDRIVFDGSVPFSGILTLNGHPAIPLFTFEYIEGGELENQAIGYAVKVYLKDEDHSPNGYIYWAGAEFITSFAPGVLSRSTSENNDGIPSTYGHSLGGVTDYLSSQVEIGPRSIAAQKANSPFSATVVKGPTGPYNAIFNLSWMELNKAYNALATVGPFSNKEIEYPKTSLDILVTANVIMASNEAQFTNITYKDPKTNTIEDSGDSIPQVFMTGNVATLAYKSDEATTAGRAENDSYGNDIGNYIKLLYARSDKNKVSIVSTRGTELEATTDIPAYSDASAGVVPAYDTPGEILYTSGWGPAPSTDGSDLTGIVPIAKGGTGADDAAEARANLGITPGNIGAATASHTHLYAGSSTPGGAANTAIALNTGRTIQTNLGSTATATFDGTQNVTPGVTGTLPISHGGTGATTADAAREALGVQSEAEVNNLLSEKASVVPGTGLVNAGDYKLAVDVVGTNLSGGPYINGYLWTDTEDEDHPNMPRVLFSPSHFEDGGNVIRVKSGVFAPAGNYAGSSSLGGAATTANKLTTARTLSLEGDASGSTTFDGSANASINATVLHHGHTDIPANSNLNNYTDAGWYRCPANASAATIENCPTSNAFSLEVAIHAGISQTLTEYMTNNPKTYCRNMYDGAWGSWYRVYTTADRPTASEVGAATASHTHTTSQVTGLDNELQEIRDLIDEVEAGTSGDYTSLQQAVNNLTSLVNTKQNIITGAATTIDTENLTANRALVSDASGKVAVSAVTSTELGYLDGVTSNVQTQLNGKAPTSHNHVSTNITGDADSVAVFDTTGTLCGSSSITTGELDMLNGVTSNIQTQLNNKAATDHDHDASDITSGILAIARIPNLDAGKVTSGTFAAARIPGLDASKITSGTISIDRLPQAALERLVIVADDTARFKLTTSQVQNGDVVKVTSSGKMYYVKDQNELDNANGYEEFAAGTAASVSWNNITGKPSTFTPSSHTHQYAGSASVGGPANSVANALTISLNGTSQGAYNGSAAKSINVTPASIGAATSGHTHNAATTSAAGFMSAADKQKLDGISASADVNQNAFSNVAVGSTTIVADTTTDTLTLVAGSNVTITPDAATDKITIAATDTKYSNATTGTSGLMSATDKAKLDGITASADSVAFSRSLTSGTKVGTITINGTATDLYAPTNTDTKYSDMVGATTSTAGTHGLVPAPAAGAAIRYLRSDGTWQVPPNTTYSTATTSANGLMSAADKAKLDGIATGANKYTHPSYTTRSSGLYKITVDATGHVSGATAVTKNDIVALGIPAQDTNTTYTLGSFGITATATELNYCDGVTSNIQTQLNSKASSSHTHNYAGSSSAGGAANSANLLNSKSVSNTDLNTVKTQGWYYGYTGMTHAQSNSISTLETIAYSNDWLIQIQSIPNSVPERYIRAFHSGETWSNWYRILHSGNYSSVITPAGIGAAASSHNHSASNITSGTLAVARGGTGITSNPSMLVNLGSTSAASVFAATPRPGITGTLSISHGGTGATDAATARSNLGFTLGNLGVTASAAELNKLDGATVTVTEINYLDGVTSSIQTQLNGKASSSHSHSYLPLSGGTLTGNLTARTITPAADSTYNIGSSSMRYANIYADTFTGNLSGNATTATTATRANTLTTARTINGTSFNGSANITTANWGTARTITIGNTGKSVNGSANVSWSLSEIGAASSSHTHSIYNKTTVGTGAPSGTGNTGDIYIDLNTGTVYRWS